MYEKAVPSLKSELYERLRGHLRPDLLSIDEELVMMPGLVVDVGEATAIAMGKRDSAKNDLEIMCASAANSLRGAEVEDGRGGIKKRSEAQIASEVPLDGGVQAAMSAYEQAKFDYNLWRALMDGLTTKSETLAAAGRLIVSGYLTPDSIRGEQRHRMVESRRARAKVRKDREEA